LVDVVAVPVRAPENVVAVIVLLDGLIVTVETVEVAAPDTDVVAGVNIIGCAKLVEASVTSTFLPVVAEPALPVRAPENVVAVIVPEDGVTNTVVTLEVAAPDTEVA
jgi:hypothetical protein